MTKKEKKAKIAELITQFTKTTDDNECEVILQKVILEIYSSGFHLDRYPGVQLAVDAFVKDLIAYQQDKKNGIPVDGKYTALAGIGLLTLIDMSLLED